MKKKANAYQLPSSNGTSLLTWDVWLGTRPRHLYPQTEVSEKK